MSGPALIADEGMYDPNGYDNKDLRFSHFRNASGLISNPGGSASGISVSSDGYILTALHVVEPCLESLGMIKTEKHETFSVNHVSSRAPKSLFCPAISFSVGRDHQSIQLKSPQVVFLGRGTAAFEDSDVSKFPPDVVELIRNSQEDFAILKFDVPGTVPCAPIAVAAPLLGEKLKSISFPASQKARRLIDRTNASVDCIDDLESNQPISSSRIAELQAPLTRKGLLLKQEITEIMAQIDRIFYGGSFEPVRREVLSIGEVTNGMMENEYHKNRFSDEVRAKLEKIYSFDGSWRATLCGFSNLSRPR